MDGGFNAQAVRHNYPLLTAKTNTEGDGQGERKLTSALSISSTMPN